MKKYLFIVLFLGFAMVGCQEQGGESSGEGDGTEMVDGANGDEAVVTEEEETKPPREVIKPKLPEGATSVLAGLDDMAYDEAYEIDDFRARLEYDMGDVNETMLAAAGMFEPEGDLLVAKGEIQNEGNVTAAIVVADPGNDCLHGASYNSESGEVKNYCDKEGMETPEVVTEWANAWK